MKNLIYILIGLISVSCTTDDNCHTEIIREQVIQIDYDSQDNILRVNGSDWMTSLDWDSFIDEDNWSAANDQFGVRHNWNGTALKVVSPQYEFTGAIIEDIYEGFYIQDNILFIDVPTMQEYMNNTDLFYFKVIVKFTE